MWEENLSIISVEMKCVDTNRTDKGEDTPLCKNWRSKTKAWENEKD